MADDKALVKADGDPFLSIVPGELSRTSLVLRDDLTEEEWIQVGHNLGSAAQGVQWFVGDWINYGVEKEYIPSDRYDAAEKITSMSRTWLQVCAWVSRAVPRESRRPDLSFEHHKRIASLKDGEARTILLNEAVKGKWTARELYDVASQVLAPQDNTTIDSGAQATNPPVQSESTVEIIEPLKVIGLGPHRLIVGDATDPDVYAKLFADQPLASVVWTDPPYGVDYVGKTEDALTIDNDTEAELVDMLVTSFALADACMKDGSAFYICHADRTAPIFRQAIDDVGWFFHQNLMWVKDRMIMGRSDYHYQYEPIAYGWKPGNVHRWFGSRNRVNVLGVAKDDDGVLHYTIPSPQASVDHPTMKPPRLIWENLRNSILSGDVVLDMFAGSGSTMVAAHQLGVRAFMIELDPTYAQVIVARWKEMNKKET